MGHWGFRFAAMIVSSGRGRRERPNIAKGEKRNRPDCFPAEKDSSDCVAGTHQLLGITPKTLFFKPRMKGWDLFCVAKMKNSHDCFFCSAALKHTESPRLNLASTDLS
jgi:hypothetical protein